jgi:hypothetical protein
LGTAGGAKRVSGSAGFDDKGGEGMHWGVGVLDRARKLHLRAPLLGGGIAVHEATVAQVEVPSSKTAVVLQDHEEYRVVCGSGSGDVSVTFALAFALPFIRPLEYRRGLPGWSCRGGSQWTFGTPRR